MKFLMYLLIGVIVLIEEIIEGLIIYGAPRYDEHLLNGWFEKHPKMYKIMLDVLVILLWPIEVIGRLFIIARYVYHKLRSK